MNLSFARALQPVDALIICGLVLITLLFVLVAGSPVQWATLSVINLSFIAGVISLALAAERFNTRFLRIAHSFYPVPMIFVVFKEVHVVLQTMARPDYDGILIAIDRWMFGTDPTIWLAPFSNPFLTELLQLSYMSYYFIMLAVGVELYRRHNQEQFALVVFTIVYGFFLSYIGYLAFPAVGPRFTLHDFARLDAELPGLLFSEPIRDFINAGESIPKGAVNPIAVAQRDVFPSGHTQMTLISMYFAWKYALRSRYVIYVFGTLLVISTVYLRYHYVIDVIGGIAFMLVTIWTGPTLVYLWKTRVRRKDELFEA